MARLPLRSEALQRLRGLALDYGVNDQYAHIPVATREFARGLAEFGVPYRLEVYDGDHRKDVPERMNSLVLPYVSSRLDPASE